MRFSVLSSGSKANSTYLEVGERALLIDCGLSCKELEIRLGLLGKKAENIQAILVTHEHSDHIYGISVLSRRYKIPVYANRKTSRYLKRIYGQEVFKTGEDFYIGDFKVSPFSIVHDASDPVGYVIEAEGLKYAQATDLGRVTPLVEDSLRGAHALLLESNHDEEMLRNCDYSWELKQRIASTHGHLSNDTASTLLSQIRHPELLHVVLGHISENSNTNELVMSAAQRYNDLSSFVSFSCGSIYRSTPLFDVAYPENIGQVMVQAPSLQN